MIQDDDGFFASLPDCKHRKRGFIPGVTKAMKLDARKKQLERAYEHLQNRIKEVGRNA